MARFAITDIHGCFQSFDALLERIALSKADTLYLLGDYIHRGPSSVKVIERIMQMLADGYHVHTLMGNHEEMALHDLNLGLKWPQLAHQVRDNFVLELFRTYAMVPPEIAKFIEELDSIIFLDDYILVHAGINFADPDPFADKFSMRWIRDWYGTLDKGLVGNRTILHGHTPIKSPAMDAQFQNMAENQYLDIDGGCVFGAKELHTGDDYGFLCAFDMDNKQLIRQPYIDVFVD